LKANENVSADHGRRAGHPPPSPDTRPREARGAQLQIPAGINAEDQQKIAEDLRRLRARLAGLKLPNADQLADARVFEKGVTWALRYEITLAPR